MDINTLLQRLAAPAQRAIVSMDIKTIEELAAHTKKQVSEWHGIGKNAIGIIEDELSKLGLSFRTADE